MCFDHSWAQLLIIITTDVQNSELTTSVLRFRISRTSSRPGDQTSWARLGMSNSRLRPGPPATIRLARTRGIRGNSEMFFTFLHSMLDVREAEEKLPGGRDWDGVEDVHSSLPNLPLCSDPHSSLLPLCSDPGPGCESVVPRPPLTRHRPGDSPGDSRLAWPVSQECTTGPVTSECSVSGEDTEDNVTSSQPPVTRPGLCYRSSVRVMVRDSEPGVAARPASRTGGEVRTTERLDSRPGSAGRVPIVRPAIRLPRDLYEKMPSAPNTPGASRREHTASKLASTSLQMAPVTKKVPKSVASMVRR